MTRRYTNSQFTLLYCVAEYVSFV